MIRATEIFAVLCENKAGDPYSIGLPGVNDRDEEGLGAIGIREIGLHTLVKLYADGPHNLDGLLNAARVLSAETGKRLEVVRFTERHHHLWIG